MNFSFLCLHCMVVVKNGRQCYVALNVFMIPFKKAIFAMKKVVTAAIHFRSEYHLCFENILIILVIFEGQKFILLVSVYSLRLTTAQIPSLGCRSLFNFIFSFEIFFRLADFLIRKSTSCHEILLLNAEMTPLLCIC